VRDIRLQRGGDWPQVAFAPKELKAAGEATTVALVKKEV